MVSSAPGTEGPEAGWAPKCCPVLGPAGLRAWEPGAGFQGWLSKGPDPHSLAHKVLGRAQRCGRVTRLTHGQTMTARHRAPTKQHISLHKSFRVWYLQPLSRREALCWRLKPDPSCGPHSGGGAWMELEQVEGKPQPGQRTAVSALCSRPFFLPFLSPRLILAAVLSFHTPISHLKSFLEQGGMQRNT